MDAQPDHSLTIREALQKFYAAHDLPPDGGAGRPYFIVRIGPLKFPLPNPGMRKRAVLYHDIHHVVTGYDTVFSRGEMIIAGYEIAAGCGPFLAAWIINLWMFALGLLITPRPMLHAFIRGRRCASLYRHESKREDFMDLTISQMACRLGLDRAIPAAPTRTDRVLFALWSIAAWAATLTTAALVVASVWAVVAATRWLVSV
jgi:hypothetical protein